MYMLKYIFVGVYEFIYKLKKYEERDKGQKQKVARNKDRNYDKMKRKI